MLTIKGRYENGAIQLLEQVEGQEGQDVTVVFPDETLDIAPHIQETDYATLTKLIEENQMETGIPDLAHQHDHYLHGRPKRTE